jgi:molybdopterin/thiamine biosynthesis adenylyltransferase
MTPFEVEVDLVRDQFREGLAAAGFNVASPTFASGELVVPGVGLIDLDVTIPDDFPYVPPRARPTMGQGGRSWHRERDGHLCLYASGDSAEPGWSNVSEFLDDVRAWFLNDAAGWPNDTPDLDLERYWKNDTGLVLFGDLDWASGEALRAVYQPGHLFPLLTVRNGLANGGKKRSRRVGARALDIGELDAPVHDWSELVEVIPDAAAVEGLIRTRKVGLLLIRYRRGGYDGTLALTVTSSDPIELAALDSAHTGPATTRLRAGQDAHVLAGKSVAVVGVGAVGSYVADGLARAGVGRLTVIDGDIVRPGNLVRHLLTDQRLIGEAKATAVAAHLRNMPWAPAAVADSPDRLTSVSDTIGLFIDHDLVIDATAAGRATALILDASRSLGKPALSVCVLRDGGIVRVDRRPVGPTETEIGPVPPSPSPAEPLREGGCGDPVSPTPPWACASAAALAVAVAADLLTGRNNYGPTTEEVLVAQPDAPYDVIGTRR